MRDRIVTGVDSKVRGGRNGSSLSSRGRGGEGDR